MHTTGQCNAAVVLYDRPVAELMIEASADLPERSKPGDFVDWFAQHYPKVKATTVRAHIIGLTVNDPSRKHMGGVGPPPAAVLQEPQWLARTFRPRSPPDRRAGAHGF